MVEKSESEQAGAGELADSWGDWLRMGIPAIVAIAAIAIAWHILQPAPPDRVIIATGSKSGVYYAMAHKYADYFAKNGIDLVVKETAGSAENFKLLTAHPGTTPDGDVDIAIVQGGTAPPGSIGLHIQAVAAIYYEPVMVFTRGDQRPTQLSQLAGKKIAIGAEGSGVRVLSAKLLSDSGVSDGAAGTTLLDYGGDRAADALSKGEIDAAFFIIAPDAPVIARLLGTPLVHLMNFDQAHAYGRLHPFLSATTLYQGVVDMEHNLPPSDVQLVASPATIVVRDNVNSAIVELLVRAAQEINGGATLLADAGTFPNLNRSELTPSKDARYFLANPPGFLRRTLPFWLASMLDRLVLLVVPLLVILIPLIRTMPMVFRWRVKRKIFRRYRRVRQIEEKLNSNSPRDELQAGYDELTVMDRSLATLKLPISFVEELYNLRTNVAYVRSRIDGWLQASANKTAGA